MEASINFANSALSLVVPIVVIAMVFLTRKVALSMLIGIALGGSMLFYNSPLDAFLYVYKKISSVFYIYEDSEFSLNLSSIYVFGFLIILGILTQIILYSGAINAFVNWAHARIKSPQGSEFIAFIAGIIIFVDDYFNALTVGQISKQLNDANKSTRERLAYIIDSTSAPVCILMPLSSWGAYIIGIMDTNIPKDLGEGLFLLTNSIWSNYYAHFALLGVFLTILWQINLPQMRKNVNVDVSDHLSAKITDKTSSIWLLIIPIFALIIFVSSALFYSGFVASKTKDLIDILSNVDTAFSLFFGGMIALILSALISFRNISPSNYFKIAKNGFLSMLPAIVILVLAWAIGPIIRDDLKTGIYLANLVKDGISGDISFILPSVLFLISAFIAFCTGTSWGTFAIMIPIGLGIIESSEIQLTLGISAILAGAVFGDHSSPISDTTILSATGAGCSVQSHFITQLPYISSVALISFFSFIFAGIFNIFVGFIFGFIATIALFYMYKKFFSKEIKL